MVPSIVNDATLLKAVLSTAFRANFCSSGNLAFSSKCMCFCLHLYDVFACAILRRRGGTSLEQLRFPDLQPSYLAVRIEALRHFQLFLTRILRLISCGDFIFTIQLSTLHKPVCLHSVLCLSQWIRILRKVSLNHLILEKMLILNFWTHPNQHYP